MLAKTAKKLDVQRAVTRLTRSPAAGMMVRQLLFFDDKKKVCDDYWIFKSAKQWEQDEGLTRQQVRTATRKLEEFGMAQVDRKRKDPLYNNTTTFYRLNIYRVMQVVDPVKLEALEPELRYLEPEYDWFEGCDLCGDDLCDGDACRYDVDAYGWHDQDTPDPTHEDAPERDVDEEWLPENWSPEDPGHESTNNQPLPENQPTPWLNQPTLCTEKVLQRNYRRRITNRETQPCRLARHRFRGARHSQILMIGKNR